MVAVEPAPEVMDVGLKVTVTPVGAPDEVRATLSADPLATVVVMLELPLAPAAMVGEVAAMVKSFVGVVVVEPVRAASKPEFGLPQPVTRS